MFKSDIIFVKPYVREFLINNYSPDIVIPEDNIIMAAWRACAQRKKKMKDKLIAQRKAGKAFGDETLVPIAFTLSKHTYVNYGYYLTPTEEMTFRVFLERLVKDKLEVSFNTAEMLQPDILITRNIEQIRKVVRVSEESFSYEGIKKYIYRQRKAAQRKADQAQAQQAKQPTLF
jgi:hypothetical protein